MHLGVLSLRRTKEGSSRQAIRAKWPEVWQLLRKIRMAKDHRLQRRKQAVLPIVGRIRIQWLRRQPQSEHRIAYTRGALGGMPHPRILRVDSRVFESKMTR